VANEGDHTVRRIDPATGQEQVSYNTGGGPRALAFDGTNMWAANYAEGTLAKIDRDTGTVVTYPVAAHPVGIAFDGTNLWVSHYTTPGIVTKLLP
jgi:DNA-binding beta-propeller fold protein YncE